MSVLKLFLLLMRFVFFIVCYLSCKKCIGFLEVDCLLCLDGFVFIDRGRCELGICRDGYYKDVNGNC